MKNSIIQSLIDTHNCNIPNNNPNDNPQSNSNNHYSINDSYNKLQ